MNTLMTLRGPIKATGLLLAWKTVKLSDRTVLQRAKISIFTCSVELAASTIKLMTLHRY